MQEIQDFPNYCITENGEVWSNISKKFLKPFIDKDGYLIVDLRKDGKTYKKRVHRLVAENFIPNPNNYPQVNHKDENPSNNNVNNLEWCDSKYNANYGTRNQRCGDKQGKPVICIETQIIYKSIAEASRQTGIQKASIGRVCNGIHQTAGNSHWKFVE